MSKSIQYQLAQLDLMTVNQLVEQYEQQLGHRCRSRNKPYLVRRIAWRLQANAEGGLSERALKRASVLANDAEIRVTPPTTNRKPVKQAIEKIQSELHRDKRLPPPGCMLQKAYKGKLIQVLVLDDGFEWEEQKFKTLSAVASRKVKSWT
jgi:hypothetical protein